MEMLSFLTACPHSLSSSAAMTASFSQVPINTIATTTNPTGPIAATTTNPLGPPLADLRSHEKKNSFNLNIKIKVLKN
jgi:hypothetical protein